jgi:hypothetical protein
MTNDTRNLRNVQGMAPRQDAGEVPRAVPGALPASTAMDLFASAWFMWTAFASRSIRNGGEIRLADLGIGKGVK